MQSSDSQLLKRFELYRELERNVKVRLLTCEAEILFSLAEGPKTAGELYARSRNSSTSFYMTLRKLHLMDVIVGEQSLADKRRTVYKLADDIYNSIIQFQTDPLVSGRTEQPQFA